MTPLESVKKCFDLMFEALPGGKKEVSLGCNTHIWKYLSGRKVGEALYKNVYECESCGVMKVLTEEGQDPRI